MLTQLFQPNDRKRETAFLWNYSGMNIGFFIGFSISGYFQLNHAYSQLFLLSSLGNFIALILTFYKWRSLGDRHTQLLSLNVKKQRTAFIHGFFYDFGLIDRIKMVSRACQIK